MQRYTSAEDLRKIFAFNMVGLYKLNAVDPPLESARFQPLNDL